MKKLNNWIGIFISILFLASCSEDFLVRPPEDSITDANFYKTNDQVLSSTALLYNKVWFDYNDKASFTLGDMRSGVLYNPYNNRPFVQFNVTGDASELIAAWSAFYTVIQQANLAIININKYAGSDVSADVKKYAIAEARFMRACAYRNLVMNWGEIPIITNNLEQMKDTTITRFTIKSVWRYITDEMRLAERDLPTTPMATGRITKYSAQGMLARFYLSRAGVESVNGVRNQTFLDSAKIYAKEVIDNSGKSLMPSYSNLFKYPYDNNNESLFELQWVFSTTWGVSNSAPAYLAYSNDIANGDGWGGNNSASWWMLSKYESTVVKSNDGDSIECRSLDQRLLQTFMLPGAVYPEITQDYTLADGTRGQRDCIYPNNTGDASFACAKKYIVGKAVDVNGEASSQHYPNNTYMQRLAEIYLIYADAILGNNVQSSDATALDYVNKIRNRAGLGDLSDNEGVRDFFTSEDIYKERLVEFAMEGMFWYDLCDIYYYNKNLALSILNEQDRGLFAIYPNQFPNPSYWTVVKTPWSTENRMIVANEGNFYMPIPTADLAAYPSLLKPAVDYNGYH